MVQWILFHKIIVFFLSYHLPFKFSFARPAQRFVETSKVPRWITTTADWNVQITARSNKKKKKGNSLVFPSAKEIRLLKYEKLSIKRCCLTHKRRWSHVDAYLHLCTRHRNKKKYYEITNYNDIRSRRGPISMANRQPTVDATADPAHFSSCYDLDCPAGHHLCGQLGTCGNRWQWIDLNL